jgi:hypothetical protein
LFVAADPNMEKNKIWGVGGVKGSVDKTDFHEIHPHAIKT